MVHLLKKQIAERKRETVFSIKYLGDTKNFPYGTKTRMQLKSIVKGNITSLFREGCSIVGIACNTASIMYLSDMASYSSPSVQPIITLSANLASRMAKKHVFVVSSNFTAKNHAYRLLISEQRNDVTVTESGEQELIDAIENNRSDEIKTHIYRVLDRLPHDVDTFVLGCTHFSLIHRQFAAYANAMNKKLTIIDPAVTMAESLFVRAEEMLHRLSRVRPYDVTFSGPVPKFAEVLLKEEQYVQ